jgi:hypothetical protein
MFALPEGGPQVHFHREAVDNEKSLKINAAI